MWDPDQYPRFADERARPFFDLVRAIQVEHPRSVIDLGCGPGGLTATLLEKWPEANIVGVDSSPEMIEQARRRAVVVGFDVFSNGFESGGLSAWQPSANTGGIVQGSE